MVCAGSPREKVVDAFQLLAAKTISLDEGFVFVVYLPNVVAKSKDTKCGSIFNHTSITALFNWIIVYSSKKPLRNHLPLPYGRGFTFVLQQHEAEWLAETPLCRDGKDDFI